MYGETNSKKAQPERKGEKNRDKVKFRYGHY